MTLLSFVVTSRLRARLACLALTASACGSSETGAEPDSSTPTASTAVDSAVAECTIEGQTRVCQCAGNAGSGRKTCSHGSYGPCTSCVNDHVKSDAAVLSTQDLCKAGYYEGGFTGDYAPGAFSLGLAMSPFTVMVEGAGTDDMPSLTLTLSEVENGPAGEFHTYTVSGGCMAGVATVPGTESTNPFAGRLDGNLDCATGSFVGTLTGGYTLNGVTGLDYHFQGPMTAQFALPGSLKDGEWDVNEPESLTGGPSGGGDGGWSAEWKSELPPQRAVDPCADLPLADGGPPPSSDAGTPSVTSDAGTP